MPILFEIWWISTNYLWTIRRSIIWIRMMILVYLFLNISEIQRRSKTRCRVLQHGRASQEGIKVQTAALAAGLSVSVLKGEVRFLYLSLFFFIIRPDIFIIRPNIFITRYLLEPKLWQMANAVEDNVIPSIIVCDCVSHRSDANQASDYILILFLFHFKF